MRATLALNGLMKIIHDAIGIGIVYAVMCDNHNCNQNTVSMFHKNIIWQILVPCSIKQQMKYLMNIFF